MDRPDRKTRKGRKNPRVPIKTYRWEDIRRSRRKGGYPWTYLYKQPFNEVVDPDEFSMDSLRRSKSTVYSSDTVEIHELTEDEDIEHQAKMEEVGKEKKAPKDHSEIAKETSVEQGTIVEEEDEENKQDLMNLESADSSDNISQYLDKEELLALETKAKEEATAVTIPETEEETKRKRKLSAESGLSLSKINLLLKNTKAKVKIPKISFPTSKTKKKALAKKTKSSPPEVKKDIIVKRNKNETPVYIHIPLKPPAGESDEFSYLEFEEKKDEPSKAEESKSRPASGGFKDFVKAVKQLNDAKLLEESRKKEEDESKIAPQKELTELKETPKARDVEIKDEKTKAKEEIDKTSLDNKKEDSTAMEISETPVTKESKKEIAVTLNPETESYVIEVTDATLDSPTTEPKEDIFEKLFEAGTSKLQQETITQQTVTTTTTSTNGTKKGRAKSEEPERKRKLSMESSYSRKSLSKLGIMKKLKEASDKIKFPKFNLSRSNSKNKKAEAASEVKEVKKVVKVATAPPKFVEPVYIHIPLKPEDGGTDQFSYLEFEEKPQEQPVKEKKEAAKNDETESVIETPVVEKDIQFIILTAPSDDETLDDHSPDIPETPLSTDNTHFFENKIHELKELAKDLVEEMTPKLERKVLDPVREETPISDKVSITEQIVEADPEKLQVPVNLEFESRDNILVDEEDGLTLNQGEKPTEVELKSSLKAEGSPILRKKVSFKRRSKTNSKDSDYEEIQPPSETRIEAEVKDVSKLEIGQSMSVDEERTYLDDKKIIKSTSLEEDYNRWSKLSDHEYEPVNPPPDEVTFSKAPPEVHIIENFQKMNPSKASSTTSMDRRMLGGIEDDIELNLELQTDAAPDIRFNAPVAQTSSSTRETVGSEEVKPEKSSKFQQAIKDKASQFKTKLHGIKKPQINLPKISKPNLQRFKIEKPNFHLPKIPDTTKINLPSFSLPRRSSTETKRSLKERQQSTESNAGDSRKPIFDYSTIPRFFKKKPKSETETSKEVHSFATAPRVKKTTKEQDRWAGQDIIRVPLHSEQSMDQEQRDESVEKRSEDERDDEREDSVERRMASHIRYDEDIDNDEAYFRENQELNKASDFHQTYNRRWDQGNFVSEPNKEFLENIKNSEYQVTDLDSPSPSEDFKFKARTQDNYSSESSLGLHRPGVLEEINSDEFFLRQKGISQDNIDMGIYLSSEIREAFRTPMNALSQMEQPYDQGSNQSLPEAPTKRKPIKKPKRRKTPHASEEQIKYEYEPEEYGMHRLPPARPKRKNKRHQKQNEDVIPYQETISVQEFERRNFGILDPSDNEANYNKTYENEHMEGKEQPEIQITDPYRDIEYFETYKHLEDEDIIEHKPPAPPRRQKSLKSLNSETNSILGDSSLDYNVHISDFDLPKEEFIVPEVAAEVPIRPKRVRSRTRSHSRPKSQHEEVSSVEPECVPCVEEPCTQDIRDCMGYALIDKQQQRDPPLPPSRRRSLKSNSSEKQKFSTVPRSLNDVPPERPLRNYSTLGQSGSHKKSKSPLEDKENIDIEDLRQYIEIDDEHRDLHSGEVIQKMRDRPLPAPPRPPRKKILGDITSQENIVIPAGEEGDYDQDEEEIAKSVHEEDKPQVEKRLILPSHYSYEEETVTHAALVVEPLNGAKILPDHELIRESRETIIPVTKDMDYYDETSEIPEDFKNLKNPEPKVPPKAQHEAEFDVLKAQKLQVADLDVDKLTVNELLANRIIVSEIDSGNLQVNEISSKSGTLKISELELPPSVIHELVEKLKAVAEEQAASSSNIEQKKNSD